MTHAEISHEQVVLVDNEAEKNNKLKKKVLEWWNVKGVI